MSSRNVSQCDFVAERFCSSTAASSQARKKLCQRTSRDEIFLNNVQPRESLCRSLEKPSWQKISRSKNSCRHWSVRAVATPWKIIQVSIEQSEWSSLYVSSYLVRRSSYWGSKPAVGLETLFTVSWRRLGENICYPYLMMIWCLTEKSRLFALATSAK